MVSKRDIKILTELLDLSDVKVISHRLHAEIGIILQTESKKSYGTCSKCGTISHKLHQNHRHIIKDLPFGEKSVYLEINRRQFKCEKCRNPFSEDLDFVRKKRTYTKRLAHQIIQEVLENDIHSVASKGIVTTEENVVVGSVNSEVTIEVAPGVEVTVIITKSSAENLKLTEGKEVHAIIKSSDVIIAVD